MSAINPWASQNVDPQVINPDAIQRTELEIQIGRRAFSAAQSIFGHAKRRTSTYAAVSLHWHGTSIDVNEGSFAVVKSGGRLSELVGDIVQVKIGQRSVYVYVVAESGLIPTDITLARRAFLAIGTWAQPPRGLIADSVSVMI